MLPSTSKGRSPSSFRQPNPVFFHYLRRIIKWQQMGIEYTFWQMLHLCTSPKVVYQHTKYHKAFILLLRSLVDVTSSDTKNYAAVWQYCHGIETKNQWARDDPAFVVICSLLLAVSALAFCAAYDHSTGHAVFVVLSALLFHFILTRVILATSCWFLTNNYLREEAPSSYVVEQRVEWLYAFDVHCNSFFPMFVLLHAHGFIALLLSNLLFMVAVSYYHYLNFLGYDVLPFLERTTFFLYPIGLVIILSPIFIYLERL